jgi:hypothetical protein
MTTRGEWTRVLRGLMWDAGEEAHRLGHGIEETNANHVILALLRPGVETVAGGALRACGITHEAFAEALQQSMAEQKPDPPLLDREIPPNQNERTFLIFLGRAEGIAVGQCSEVIRPEHMLVAALWDTNPYTTPILDRLGTSREVVREKLLELGADLPKALRIPEPLDLRRETVAVPLDHWDRVFSYVSTQLPPGTDWGFNLDEDEGIAWISAEGVDLASIIERALADSGSGDPG